VPLNKIYLFYETPYHFEALAEDGTTLAEDTSTSEAYGRTEMTTSPQKETLYKKHYPNGNTLVLIGGPVDIAARLATPPQTAGGSAGFVQAVNDNEFREALQKRQTRRTAAQDV
jgi:hypothetical protein